MLTLTPTDITNFTADACKEIEKSHNAAWLDIGKQGLARPQYEPQFVATLCAAARQIASQWRKRVRVINPALKLSVASVFTHQTPYVEWAVKTTPPSTKRCELADLLVAVIDRTGTAEEGWAVLIQAKQSDTGSTTLTTPSEMKQFELLSTRPIFDVDATPAPKGVNLVKLTPDDALMYGLNPPDVVPVIPLGTPVGTPPTSWGHHRWEMADRLQSIKGSYSVTAGSCLATMMVEQLQGKRGWRFDLPPTAPVLEDWSYFIHPPHKDDWSALVNYLLKVTAGKPLAQLAGGGGSPPDRGLEEPLYFISRTPGGRPMFAVMQRDGGGEEPPTQKPDPEEVIEREGEEPWKRVHPRTFSDLYSVAPDGRDGRVEGQGGWENGPISAIVFELDRRRD